MTYTSRCRKHLRRGGARVRILSYYVIICMYYPWTSYRLFLPDAHDLPYSLLVCSSTIQRGHFSCVIPSVSPIDDGLPR